MRTGLTKEQKETHVWFNEANPTVHVRTHNTKLKKRLSEFSEAHPECCTMVENDDAIGCMEFEVQKSRFTYRLTAPYSEERRKQASVAAKKNPVKW